MTYRPIRIGDVVCWHEITCDWVVIEVHRNGLLTIETEIVDGEATRVERRQARQRDCRVIGQQIAMSLGEVTP